MRVTLAMKPMGRWSIPIEAESIVPVNFLSGTDLSVWRGNRELGIEEAFSVLVEGDADRAEDVEVVLSGETARLKRVGEYMDAGKITVLGDIGMHCGNFMSGGMIEIQGNADGWLGREMAGGSIICRGNAADYCASGYRGGRKGMTGGSVEVFGRAGDFLAENLAGGTVIVHGDAGDMPGAEMRGGTLIIHGDCRRPAANMKGGACSGGASRRAARA
ncbi:MAG TPA: formylmethanofuran dehydrogenase subunit C, partial [Methanoculleus sp.]|nr:formylmethanofuran dehydrogenase subunit C [Methanoculleus sp.]